jgi:tRNA (guanine-N7-)-methyltransferase
MFVKSCANNPYVEMMYSEFKCWAYDESASQFRGHWREKVFQSSKDICLDLEIGTGNGTHFAHRAQSHPDRLLVGMELKYKTLVQSIRRSLRAGCENSRMVRGKAEDISQLFAHDEINHVFIYFPDPWPKKKQHKNRLIQAPFVNELHTLMQTGSFVDFKTDDKSYFDWALKVFRHGPFTLIHVSEDLHRSFYKEKNFVTQFESLFLKKGQPIYHCRLLKEE